jgi:uncharacterized protein
MAHGTERVNASLFFGSVMHERLKPVNNRFRYPVFFIQVPLSQLQSLRGPLFSIDRWNVFGLYRRDYGPRDGSELLAWMQNLLRREGLADVDGEIVLQTFPRVLGYVFNPVSFWLCHDRDGALRAVLAEVNNTFGEHHVYLLSRPDRAAITGADWFETDKRFHVSPFLKIDGRYRFRFTVSDAASTIRIDHTNADGELLRTSVAGRARPLTTGYLIHAFFRYPWMSLGVMLRIHWQALKLWSKGVAWYRKPTPPLKDLTR